MKKDDFPGKPSTVRRGVAPLRVSVEAPMSGGGGRAAMLQQAENAGRHASDQLSAQSVALEGAFYTADEWELLDLPLDVIVRSPYQPRRFFNEKAIEELATSIQSIGLGKPILVRPLPNGSFELIGGERRWRASRLGGLLSIKALVRPVSDVMARMLAMTDNEQEDLCDYEWGHGYHEALASGDDDSQRALARRLGINVSIVSRRLTFMKLPREVLDLLDANPKLITANYVKTFLDLAVDHKDIVVSVVKEMMETGLQQEAAIRTIQRKLAQPGSEPQSSTTITRVEGLGNLRVSGKKLELKYDKGVNAELLRKKIEAFLNGLDLSEFR